MITKFAVIAVIFAFLVLGRTTVPGHGLTGWPGIYEAFAHIGVGVLLGLAWLDARVRWPVLGLLGVATIVEVIAFMAR